MAARKKTAKKTTRKSTTKTSAKRKTTVRKTTAKKKSPAKRKTATRKTAAKRPTAKKAAIKVGKKPYTKSEILNAIAEHTELTRKQVSSVFDALGDVIKPHVGKSGPGLFSIPGLMKIKVVKKPATKARKGINPFTGEEMMFKAKPASRKVKILPLKSLKDMAN